MKLAYFAALSRMSIAIGSFSGLATGLMMAVIVTDVVGRALFAAPLPLATEISILLLIVKVFLGMPGAQATNSNFQVTIVIDMLPPGVLRIQRILSLAVSFCGIAVIAWLTARYAAVSTEQGEISFGVHAWPIWPERIILAFGLALLALQILSDLAATIFWGDDKLQASLPRHSGSI